MKLIANSRLAVLGVAFGWLLVSASASAAPPLSCTTADGNFRVTAMADPGGVFPTRATCPYTNANGDTFEVPCSDYGYTVESIGGSNADHTFFAVSVDQTINRTLDKNGALLTSTTIAAPGAGDTKTNFLVNAFHEYAVRFNSNGSVWEGHMIINGVSAARPSTALMTAGKIYSACEIAGPGVAGDTFQPIAASETGYAAGGKCKIVKTFDSSGKLASIALAPDETNPACHVGNPSEVLINGLPLRNNTSSNGITFGNNTTTCYGPPSPSTPWCVCTALPCP